MLQGTASHVGKSVITAAVCRWLARQGYRVAPFKAQNMSLNSAVTADGGEIGRSQAVQAAACGVEPETAMNPVLLKPMAGGRCQVIVRGRPYRIVEGYGTREGAELALAVAAEALAELRSRFDFVILEGMGSPAEINLRDRDVANMRSAALAGAPVLLIGDIERGGVFASLAGTVELLPPEDRARLAGFLINKMHGDPAVLLPGLEELQSRYGIPTAGVLSWQPALHLPEEDAVALDTPAAGGVTAPGRLHLLVPRFPGISNFTDLDPFTAQPDIRVHYLRSLADWPEDPPAGAQLVLLPGSRSVVADLHWLRVNGLADRIQAHARSGGRVVGVCGGYQMLGRALRDPYQVESQDFEVPGLGLVDVVTTFAPEKRVARTAARCLVPGLEGATARGYEIHHGQTVRAAGVPPAFRLDTGEEEGAATANGCIFGTYLHGLFTEGDLFARLLAHLRLAPPSPQADPFPALADWWEAHVDLALVRRLLGLA